MLDIYLDLLDTAFYEATFGFEGLSDDNVWNRPAETLLSVGEIAGHIAYWTAVRFAGEGDETGRPDDSTCRIDSPLVDKRFRYYTATLPDQTDHPIMTAQQVGEELMRIHKESMAQLKAANSDLDAPPPGWEAGGSTGNTLREALKYQIFHVSYHVGQIYSARHLLGENPPDN